MGDAKYIENDFNVIKDLCSDAPILILTATDIETEHTHSLLKPLNGYNQIIKVHEGDSTYYFGLIGNYLVANVQTTMGSLSRNSSMMTVSSALSLLKCKIVIMVGIAFGVDDEKQNIGDVLLSESIIPYNSKRVGESNIVARGIEAPSSKVLLNRFKNVRTTWEHITTEQTKVKLIPTRLLSGEELVDNLDYRNKLVADYPDSKGGEMEGAGLYAACDTIADWIIVKGICDFADGNKKHNKKARQEIAIKSALSVVQEVFNSKTVFKDLKVYPFYRDTERVEALTSEMANMVLFDIYNDDKEPFYIKRDTDDIFNDLLKQYSIWVFGPSGCGKTNLIIRNLKFKEKKFIQISLATCIGQDIDSLFYEILYEIASKIGEIKSYIEPTKFSECSRNLIQLLKKYYESQELIIFIEEIPISDVTKNVEFASKFFSILVTKNLVPGLEGIKFVLSSINDPQAEIKVFQQKIHQQINFFKSNYWEEDEVKKLISLVERHLAFEMTDLIKEKLIQKAAGSPRFIKKFFRSVCAINKTDAKTLNNIIDETYRELNQFKDV